jgi:hypothetical protein
MWYIHFGGVFASNWGSVLAQIMHWSSSQLLYLSLSIEAQTGINPRLGYDAP